MKRPFSKTTPADAQGFYWVRFEGEPIVAEFTLPRNNCARDLPYGHWHIPGSPVCTGSAEICERLSEKLVPPQQ